MPSPVHLRRIQHLPERHSPLPNYAYDDKRRRKRSLSFWTTETRFTIPGSRKGRRLLIPDLRRIHQLIISRYGRARGSLLVLCAFLLLALTIFAFTRRFVCKQRTWPGSGRKPTLVFRREDLQRIWKWEIDSGHYPSRRKKVPTSIGFDPVPNNPAIPFSTSPEHFGIGPSRIYPDVESKTRSPYPPRPVPGGIADLDILMDHCDFTRRKYVRDCLEVLRVGAGLDHGKRVRRSVPNEWKYIFVESTKPSPPRSIAARVTRQSTFRRILRSEQEDDEFTRNRNADWEKSPVLLPPLRLPSPPTKCDIDNPRIFHMYWTGVFTDKPYLSILSFLYTQNLELHLPEGAASASSCSPQLWLWINPVPAAAIPHETAEDDLFDQLRTSVWASPFLHSRFKKNIQFKFWNTTEQLDSVAELKDDWRNVETLFFSGGQSISIPLRQYKHSLSGKDDLTNRTGSKSFQSYDRLSVVMSDVARFILCHRFGGIYLDADTIFLRDWEELWGWKGAFAYRWSYHDKYNTAVLRLRKGSALGTLLLRTALKNDFDFHPMSVSNYLRDARMEELLYRLPDALFDSAWLNMEGFQRERPPQPFFVGFEEFFTTQTVDSAGPHALGFDGFFQGAFSYHFHNAWWKSVDPTRNWPDLGPDLTPNVPAGSDQGDLCWAAVLKRTFEAFVRGERPSMYGEWMHW
ncbi:hypothetical protein C8J56DRAFT_1122695 [Mycena floridula]|nr:hypothetical protein C8J56DRAFT_1122695 [Mycena floridula]